MMAGKMGKLFPIAIIGLFASGAYMTSTSVSPWSWSTRWIDVGIAALVVLTVQGAGIAERTGHKLGAALQANGPGPLGPEARRMTLHPGLWVVEFSNLGIVFGVVWNMTAEAGARRIDRGGGHRLRGRRRAGAPPHEVGAGGARDGHATPPANGFLKQSDAIASGAPTPLARKLEGWTSLTSS